MFITTLLVIFTHLRLTDRTKSLDIDESQLDQVIDCLH